MSAYEELRNRVLDAWLLAPNDYDGVGLALAEVLRTLETATPEMGYAGFDQLDMEPSPHSADACWWAMLHASALEPKP